MSLRKSAAALLALLGVGVAVLVPTRGNLLLMAAMLLMAWDLAFTDRPGLRTPLAEVHARAKRGELRTSKTSKLIVVASLLIFALGIYLNVMAGW